ncbi:hypothetical protein BHM03_00007614 [Ensete ventricosum]|nr:hypothetical protein BHM03_00007614 [Ensete ventricosum]
MYVVKRDGRPEAVHFDKITARLKKLSYGLSQEHCDPVLVAQKVCAGVYKGVTTSQLDELAAETAAAMTANHPDYASVCPAFVFFDAPSFPFLMYHNFNERSGQEAPLIADDVYEIIMKNAACLDSEIIYDRDFDYDYFGFKTLERSYLLKVYGKVVERPQHMLMRVAVGIHKDDIKSVIRTYHLMSQRWFTHASPTLFNAGTPRPQVPDIRLVLFFCKLQLLILLFAYIAKKVVAAQNLWFEILKSQIETGTPYMLFKDTCNRKSNQQNLGTIKSSNLCTEIIEYTSPTETAVCNLASIALPRFVREKVCSDGSLFAVLAKESQVSYQTMTWGFCDFRTVWEIKQRTLVDMAVDRGCYIDQSQSLNIHMDQPNFGKLTSLHFYAWSKGLKTGMYYLRSRAAADAIKFTVDTSLLQVQFLF